MEKRIEKTFRLRQPALNYRNASKQPALNYLNAP